MIPRIFIKEDLIENKEIELGEKNFHYIANVLRSKIDDEVIFVNGRDGEFLSKIIFLNNKRCNTIIIKKLKNYSKQEFLGLIFAPIQKIDILLKSSTELGVTDFYPISTDYTNKIYTKLNKIEGNIIEAIEQSERLDFPNINKILSLKEILEKLNTENNIIFFCEERTGKNSPLDVYKSMPIINKNIYCLVGPEGGFTEEEKKLIKSYKNTISISLGNTILRAETAVTSILSIIKAFYIKS